MRRRNAKIRKIIPDAKYHEVIVSRFVNRLMNAGKKSVVEKAVYQAFQQIETKFKKSPIEVFKEALENITPKIEVRSRRIGGATYQVPVEVKPARATALALRWLVDFSRVRREKSMTERLMNEILDASNGLGASVKKREDTHKMAEANKAFAHYRW